MDWVNWTELNRTAVGVGETIIFQAFVGCQNRLPSHQHVKSNYLSNLFSQMKNLHKSCSHYDQPQTDDKHDRTANIHDFIQLEIPSDCICASFFCVWFEQLHFWYGLKWSKTNERVRENGELHLLHLICIWNSLGILAHWSFFTFNLPPIK